jgi:1,4-alpha-glucan branching enzyme
MSINPKRKMTFTFKDEPGKKVYVAGTFNDWGPNAAPMADRDQTGVYAATLRISRGNHEYKYVVDGVWMVDPANPDCVINGHGSMNSMLVV